MLIQDMYERMSSLGPLTYESVALPTALRGPAVCSVFVCICTVLLV